MAMSVKKGTLSAPTGATGNQAYTGVGFTPKAILFWGVNSTADGYAANSHFFFGAAISGADRSIALGADDAVATTNTGRKWSSDAINIATGGTPTIDAVATIVSMDVDGFTLNWTDTATSGWVVHYLAIGGSDITNVALGTMSISGSSGTQAVTGLGFQPEACVFFSNVDTAADPSTASGYNFSLGVAAGTGSASQWCMTMSNEDALATSSTSNSFYTDKCAVMGARAGTGMLTDGNMSAFGSDGFTLNWTTGGAGGAQLHYLAIKTSGSLVKAGNETQKTSTGTKATTGLGSQPAGVFFGSTVDTTTGSFNLAQGKATVGAGDGTNEGAIWVGNQDSTASNSNTNHRNISTKVISMSTEDTTTNAEADLASMDSDGFTLDWTTADATARAFGYLAFMTGGGGGGGGGSAAARKMTLMC